jgi:hypothetical protein
MRQNCKQRNKNHDRDQDPLLHSAFEGTDPPDICKFLDRRRDTLTAPEAELGLPTTTLAAGRAGYGH